MATTAMVHVRVDENIKAKAAETLAAMGLSVSDAVRVFLTRVAAERKLPFELRVPNAESRTTKEKSHAIIAAIGTRFTGAAPLFDDREKNISKAGTAQTSDHAKVF